MRVYLVEDSPLIRERLRRMLSELDGAEIVGEAEDARTATESILNTRPDVVLLDIRILGGSGIEVLQAIKQKRPATVVIVLTNYPYPLYRQKSLEAGADYFFVKSTEFDKVVPVLKGLKPSLFH